MHHRSSVYFPSGAQTSTHAGDQTHVHSLPGFRTATAQLSCEARCGRDRTRSLSLLPSAFQQRNLLPRQPVLSDPAVAFPYPRSLTPGHTPQLPPPRQAHTRTFYPPAPPFVVRKVTLNMTPVPRLLIWGDGSPQVTFLGRPLTRQSPSCRGPASSPQPVPPLRLHSGRNERPPCPPSPPVGELWRGRGETTERGGLT